MGFKLSKKKLQEIAKQNVDEILNDIGVSENVQLSIGFVIWNSINESYKIGYKNAKRKFAPHAVSDGGKNGN